VNFFIFRLTFVIIDVRSFVVSIMVDSCKPGDGYSLCVGLEGVMVPNVKKMTDAELDLCDGSVESCVGVHGFNVLGLLPICNCTCDFHHV